MAPRDTVNDVPAGPSVSSGKMSWKEVAKHNTAKSAWVIFKGGVYDITEWLDDHPGGKEMLLLVAGRDVTDIIPCYHPFSDKPEKFLKPRRIGEVVDDEFPVYSPDSGFYKTVRARVGEYFMKNNIDPRSPWAGLWRMALVFTVAFVSLGITHGLLYPNLPFAARVVAAVIFGICQALPLLHVMHDASHAAIGPNEMWWKIIGRFCLDWYAGASMMSWQHQHTIGHHIYTNVLGADPDMPVAEKGDPRRLVPRQVWSKLYKFQHIYLPVLYGVLGMKFRIQDITDTYLARMNGPIRVNYYDSPILRIWITKAVWACWRILLPLYLTPYTGKEFALLFFIAEMMTGYYLAFNFQVSHVSTVADFPNDTKHSANIDDEWAVAQVKTSVDYAHDAPIPAFLSGALNYQIVHHLFPSVSQYHYPAIAPIVKQVCKQYDVPYRCLPTFGQAFLLHLRHLKEMGAAGKPVSMD